MSEFQWQRAQEEELNWWRKWQKKELPPLGEGGLSRYPLYLQTFTPCFSHESILDVGSGAFPLINWLELCPRRVALDPLNSKFAAEGFARARGIEYLDGLAEQLPFPDGSFEQVFLLNMLDHLEHWRKAVDEAVRVASKNVLIHVHIDGPFAGDGMHKILRETELVDYLEHHHHGRRLPFRYPVEHRSFLRRCGSMAKKFILHKGVGFYLPVELCWTGIIYKT